MSPPTVLAGNAHPALAGAVAEQLGTELGETTVERFPDGEAHVVVHEPVRGGDVYLVQPTGPPADAHLVELALLADACRRADADRITAVVPYFGYARGDRRSTGGEAVATRVAADIAGAGLHRMIVVDPHTPALEAAAPVPLESVSAVPLLADALAARLPAHPVVVAPDLGAVKLAERFGAALGVPAAFVRKTRRSAATVEAAGVVGEVRGRTPVVVDDMISTGGTIEAAVGVLADAGAEPDVRVAATHGLLVGDAAARMAALPLRELVISDSLPPADDLPVPCHVVSLAGRLAAAISRLHDDRPLAELASHG